MVKKFGRRLVAIAAAALMVTATAAPAFAATGNFHFQMPLFLGYAVNTTGTTNKGTDGERAFYVTPTGGSWTPGYDYPHAFAINVRGQECNRNPDNNLLSANYNTTRIPYYEQSVPAANQPMNIKIKEYKEGAHQYSMDGRWTP